MRTPDPPIDIVEGRTVVGLRRLGKRIVFELEGGFFLVLHLMIAGRLRWRERGAPIPGKVGLAAFDFPTGTAVLTEAGSRRQASLHLVRAGAAGCARSGRARGARLESVRRSRRRLTRENHTLKRALTDPHIFSGIGNAYSDEILHAARLSPMKLTATLGEDEIARLFEAAVGTLARWIRRLRDDAGGAFPEKVTAFREGMAVHGRFRQPCPVCGAPVQRIVYAHNEANYCARCQTGGRLLADRALSRLLREDWPKTLDAMEQRLGRKGQ